MHSPIDCVSAIADRDHYRYIGNHYNDNGAMDDSVIRDRCSIPRTCPGDLSTPAR